MSKAKSPTKTKAVNSATPESAAVKSGETSRTPSKKSLLTDALLKPGGTTIEQMCSMTGWQSHSVRAALTGLKKKGFEVIRTKTEGKSIYSIATLAEAAK